MKNSMILVAIGKDASLSDLAKKLEAIRAIPAHATILVIGQTPHFPYYAMGVPPYGATVVPDEWQEAISDNKRDLEAKAEEVQNLLKQHDVSGEVGIISTEPSLLADAIAQRAMLCDMALIGDDLRASDTQFQQIVYGVLFQSPIGVMLNDHHADTLYTPKKVFLAWNTDLHTARAVHQSLPLLRQADEVLVATIDPIMSEFRDGEDPGVDVAKWLTHHGCKVDVQQYPSGGHDIGDCILDHSKEYGADLIVMGSYGHSRTRQAIFGGTTRTLIEQTDQAVFLAH
jgi:nucleotide-binding universal stress UspA family protein